MHRAAAALSQSYRQQRQRPSRIHHRATGERKWSFLAGLKSRNIVMEDKDACVGRLREGHEFFKSMAQRRSDLEAVKTAAM